MVLQECRQLVYTLLLMYNSTAHHEAMLQDSMQCMIMSGYQIQIVIELCLSYQHDIAHCHALVEPCQ